MKLSWTGSFCLYKINRAQLTIDVSRNLIHHSFKSKVDKLQLNKHFMSKLDWP